MCTLRALWIVREDLSDVLLSRRFPTVERRAKRQRYDGSEYCAVPCDKEFLELFREQYKHFPESATRSMRVGEKQRLWPVVHIQRGDVLCIALPLPSHVVRGAADGDGDTPLIELPCVPVTVSLLEDISVFTLRYSPAYTAVQLADINMLISVAMPFGTPLDTDMARIGSIAVSGFGSGALAVRRPAWKPYLYRGQQLVRVVVRETVRGAQYDRENIPNVIDVSGSVEVEAALEGMPDVTVLLSQNQKKMRLTSISMHPCCTSQGDVLASKKLVFSPPLEPFDLCHYSCAAEPANLPVRGFYQLKSISDREARILLQLKLSAHVNNDFEFFDVLIPFSKRGRVASAERAPTAGSVSVTKDGKGLWWKIGNKFTTQNLEVALPATVYFDEPPRNVSPAEADAGDPFCDGNTGYVKILFRMNNYTASGVRVESQHVSIYPKSKTLVDVVRVLESDEYYIWNSDGFVRHAVPAPFTPGISAGKPSDAR